MWRVIKKMYIIICHLEVRYFRGEKLDSFNVEQGMAQGCSLPPILLSVFINDLLKEA